MPEKITAQGSIQANFDLARAHREPGEMPWPTWTWPAPPAARRDASQRRHGRHHQGPGEIPGPRRHSSHHQRPSEMPWPPWTWPTYKKNQPGCQPTSTTRASPPGGAAPPALSSAMPARLGPAPGFVPDGHVLLARGSGAAPSLSRVELARKGGAKEVGAVAESGPCVPVSAPVALRVTG